MTYGMRDEGLADGTCAQWDGLLARLRELGVLTVACSGGVDSRFLAHAAREAGVALRLVHVCGPHVAPAETAYALQWAAGRGLRVRMLELDPLGLPEVEAGGRERCYACKSFLFREVARCAEGVLCDGSNASDASQFRPGLRALRELGVVSPLAEAGLTKDDIRGLAARTGLEWPGQQSRACLLTRLPYGMRPGRALLAQLAEGERAVEDILAGAGLGDASYRLRVVTHDAFELHVGVPSLGPQLSEQLADSLEKSGFHAAVIRCMAAVSGYFDAGESARISRP